MPVSALEDRFKNCRRKNLGLLVQLSGRKPVRRLPAKSLQEGVTTPDHFYFHAQASCI